MSPRGIEDLSALSPSGAGFHLANANCELLCCSQERNLDWFPRMRAMSLVSSDSEGEQNELRNLQEKLESTMKLVTNLSGQLSELKDQVRVSRETRLRTCWYGQDKGPARLRGFCEPCS